MCRRAQSPQPLLPLANARRMYWMVQQGNKKQRAQAAMRMQAQKPLWLQTCGRSGCERQSYLWRPRSDDGGSRSEVVSLQQAADPSPRMKERVACSCLPPLRVNDELPMRSDLAEEDKPGDAERGVTRVTANAAAARENGNALASASRNSAPTG